MVTSEEVKEMLADYVTVTLKMPKQVAEFYRDQSDNLEEFLVSELVDNCCARIDAVTPKMIADRYPGLKEIFKEYHLDVTHL